MQLTGLDKGVHDIVKKILKIAERKENIVLVGLFGSAANRITCDANDLSRKTDADIDTLIVVNSDIGYGTKEQVKTELERCMSPETTTIIWGDDETYYYFWRTSDKINIDIEIRSYQSKFYIENLLLGHSIFRTFIPLYSHGGEPYRKHLCVPVDPLSKREIAEIVLTDRKGLIEFKERLSSKPFRTDPRRIVGLILRNMTWAESAHYPVSVKVALSYLEKYWQKIFPHVDIKLIKDMLAVESDKAQSMHSKFMDVVLELLDESIGFLEMSIDNSKSVN